VIARMSNQTITIRTKSETVEKISAIAKAMDRSRNWVIEDALKQYIDQQGWYIEGIQQAQASLASGKGIPHEEVMAEISELIEERIRTHENNQ
jgi:predicted transcriptional regulator